MWYNQNMKISPFLLMTCLVAAVLCGCTDKTGATDLAEGKAAYEIGDYKKAERSLDKCLKLAPNTVDALVYLVKIKLAIGELTQAREFLDRAQELDGGATDIRFLDAQLNWNLKDYPESAQVYNEMAENQELDAETRSLAWTGLGIVEMTCNNYHLARIDFLRALRLDRRNASAWYHLGLLYRDGMGYAEAALEQFEIFVRLEAEADIRVQKVQRKFIPELKETIAKTAADRPGAAGRNSEASAALIVKAEAEWKKGNFKTARQRYQEALNADALSYPAALGLAKAWLKTDATKAGQQKALENYRLACALRPSAVSTFLTAGELAAKLGLHAQAVEIYSRALAANPASIEATDGIIRALRKTNRAKVAEAYQLYRETVAKRK